MQLLGVANMFVFRAAAIIFLATSFSFISVGASKSAALRGVDDDFEIGEEEVLLEEKRGTFVIEVKDYEDGHDSISLNIMIDHLVYELEEVLEDEVVPNDYEGLKSGQAVTIPAGTVLGAKSAKAKFNGGKIKPVKDEDDDDGGKKKKKEKKEKSGLFGRNLLNGRTEDETLQRNVDQFHRHLYSTTFGDKKVVAVIVQTNDGVYEDTEDDLRGHVFGLNPDGSSIGNTFDLSSGYEQCSYGAITFSPLDTQPGIDNGVVTVAVDMDAVGSNSTAVRNEAITNLKEMFGDDIIDAADYWMFCMPPNTEDSYIAYAFMYGRYSVYRNKWCNSPSSQMHELGHNLGFNHSADPEVDHPIAWEYADTTGMMGMSYSDDEGPVMCFNSAKSWQSGWYGENGAHGDKTLEMTIPYNTCIETSLSGIADYDTTSNLVLIKILNPDYYGADFFVSFNAKKGINHETQEHGDKVIVVQVPSGGGRRDEFSYFLKELGAGDNHTIDDLTIEVDSIAGSNFANIKICGALPTSTRQFAVYDPSLGAPRCSSYGSACDSQGLLHGRASGGNERNQPNTLNSCTDGKSAPFHLGESVDNIVVSQAPGITSDMSEGDTVTITATVWCYSHIARIDFYYTSDATNPVWVQIGERQQCPGGGEQTVTAEYTLPEGEIQAVRANIMWGDPIVRGESCTTGGYDDIDDLVFSVKAIQPTAPPSPQTPPPTSNAPTRSPTNQPSKSPTSPPTAQPTNLPTPVPSNAPSKSPTNLPTPLPSKSPTNIPTPQPSKSPTNLPTPLPSNAPSNSPTNLPTPQPSKSPTNQPTHAPSDPPFTSKPTEVPTPLPSKSPTKNPTSEPTAPPSDAPTPMPTNDDDGNGPQLASYDPSLGAPKCSFGSSCDSQGLLDGCGTMANGNEPNQPNTLNSCTDGSSGTYHIDESVDKIIVSQAPGITSDMTEGDTVTITATVWCWSNGASDYIDFYYASDATATNPVWVQIGERQQCPGGGAQTVTAEYTLPEGEIQAVRVNLMYSNPASADSCTTGGYDDTDDLVFLVKESQEPLTSTPTSSPTKNPTPMPTNADDSGPQSAAYDASFDAPKCSFGSSCDSQGLLDGCGTMANGNEPNQPNTLNSCTDGSSGTYHSDESVDKIVVSQVPGITSDMSEGDTVTITATVWCWSNGASDYIDFYYASDATATNPVWVQIGERQQCPGGGAQTVTAEYILPEGEIQAVRVNLMYQSSTVSTDSCTTGGYDDTDDLVISVRSTSGPNPQPSALPTQSPTTGQPTSPPSNSPTPQPSASPTRYPTKQPTSPPSKSPTPPPSALPTRNPTKQPTLPPSNSPTPLPSALPTRNPTKQPTSPPSNSPTPLPSASPTRNPTKQPTSPPSNSPTKQPTSPPSNSPTPPPSPPSPSTKTLVCGRGDIPTNPCAEGLRIQADVNTVHEIRCCQTNMYSSPAYWKKKCPQYNWALYARSKFSGTCKVGTFAEAVDFCKNVPGDNTRLCTPDELENSCAKGTGCNFDKEMIWSCAYDGHLCSSDTECCGTCWFGKCQGGIWL